MTTKRMTNNKGLALIELLVYIAIPVTIIVGFVVCCIIYKIVTHVI